MLYNIPEITDFVSFLQFLQSIIPFAQLSLLAIFSVSFFALKRYETTKALPASLFITFISSLALYLMKLLEINYVYGSAIALGLSIILIYFSQREF
jgi:hypothetical protein